jgi:hypothetical protein
MKKSYLILAAVAGLLASCSNEVLVEETANDASAPRAIGFSTFAEKATRSTADFELETYHKTFVVYGTKTDDNGGAVQAVFGTNNTTANTGVTCDFIADAANYDLTEAWHYTPARYWDKQAQYYFAAYTPAAAPLTYVFAAAGDEVGATGAKFQSTSNYVIKGQNRMQDETPQAAEVKTGFDGVAGTTLKDLDIMVSDLNGQHGDTHDAYVDLIFRHTLAKLNVALDVEKAAPAAGVAGYKVLVQSVSADDFNSTGSFSSALSTLKYEPTWTVVGTDKVNYTYVSPAFTADPTDGDQLGVDDLYFIESLVMPQDIAANQVITIKYRLISVDAAGNEYPENYTYKLAMTDAFAAPTYTDYEENSNYTVKFHLNPENNVIKFDAGVSEWTNKYSYTEDVD